MIGARSTLLHAAWVIPVCAPPIRDGCVEIIGSRIGRVGPRDAFGAHQPIEHLGNAILTPGLINAHTHLELTTYAGRLAPAPFWDWVNRLVALRRQPGAPQRELESAYDGAWRSLRAGVTCVGDISRRADAWTTLKATPIRKVCFAELLAFAAEPPRDLDELRTHVARTVEDPLLTIGVSPHAPYSVPAQDLRDALALAADYRRPWTMHLAETWEEVRFLAGDPEALPPMIRTLQAGRGVASPNCRPSDYLAQVASATPPGLLAHGNYLDPAQFARLADHGHTIVYCPRAHHFFGHVAHPFRALRAAGVNVCIGTDSLAGNASLSLLDELKFVSEQVPDAPGASELLEMITADAARGLGLDAELGSLLEGRQADLAAFPLDADNARTTAPLEALIRTAPPPTAVWVAGRRIV